MQLYLYFHKFKLTYNVLKFLLKQHSETTGAAGQYPQVTATFCQNWL